MEGMILSFDESQRLQQVRTRSKQQVPTLSTVAERPEPTANHSFTAVRPTAVEKPSRWHRIWHGMACTGSQSAEPAAPSRVVTAPKGAWVACVPPVPVTSIEGLTQGYQVRTTQGMDMTYGVPLPGPNDATEMVTMYRDLNAVADSIP